MKKQLLTIGIIVILLIVGLSGCNESTTDNDVSPSILQFYISDYKINEGGTTSIIWEVINSEIVSIDNGIGYVSLNGQRTIAPTNTTTYTLTAKNGDKETYATAKIIVEKLTDEEKIIGTWVYSTTLDESTVYVYYIFRINLTLEIIFLYTSEDIRSKGTWKIQNNKLIITLKGETIVNDYSFSNNNKTLTLIESNGVKSIFTKQ